jgi:hypothetical protein
MAIAWATAFALWPWLQIGNPLRQFAIAYTHFATIAMEFSFPHWGAETFTNALPLLYVPEQWLARLPTAFLGLIALAALLALADIFRFGRDSVRRWRQGAAPLRGPALVLARSRGILLVWTAAAAPVAFLMIQRPTFYDGVRHTLFVIPMLALIAGWALVRLTPRLRRARAPVAALAAAYVATAIVDLARLHPLEYVATNALAGGTAGSYGRFELDYGAAGATEGLRQLERRLDAAGAFAQDDEKAPPSLLVCIQYRESMVAPMLHKSWRIELDPRKADFVIESERSRCAAGISELKLVDEVVRDGRAFGWTYVNGGSRFFDAPRR